MARENTSLVTLDVTESFWKRFYTVSPLVVVGTKGQEGYNLAPKNLAMPMGWQNYFGFVCTPRHRTYQNVKAHGAFTVSYPRPEQVKTVAALAGPHADEDAARSTARGRRDVPTLPAQEIDGVFLDGGYLFLECRLERVIDRLGKNSLIIGAVAAVHVHQEALRAPEQDDEALVRNQPLLAYLDFGRYATVRESAAFPFEEGFDASKAYPTSPGFADFGT